MIVNWNFYEPFYTFPLCVKVGSGDRSYEKWIYSVTSLHQFLRSEVSMISYNTSQADIVALGNVLDTDIIYIFN